MTELFISIIFKVTETIARIIGFILMLIGRIYHFILKEECTEYYLDYYHTYEGHMSVGFEVFVVLSFIILSMILLYLFFNPVSYLIKDMIINIKTSKVEYEERVMIIVDKNYEYSSSSALVPINGLLMPMKSSSEEYTIKLRDRLSYRYVDSEYLYDNANIKDEVRTTVKIKKDKKDNILDEYIIDYELI